MRAFLTLNSSNTTLVNLLSLMEERRNNQKPFTPEEQQNLLNRKAIAEKSFNDAKNYCNQLRQTIVKPPHNTPLTIAMPGSGNKAVPIAANTTPMQNQARPQQQGQQPQAAPQQGPTQVQGQGQALGAGMAPSTAAMNAAIQAAKNAGQMAGVGGMPPQQGAQQSPAPTHSPQITANQLQQHQQMQHQQQQPQQPQQQQQQQQPQQPQQPQHQPSQTPIQPQGQPQGQPQAQPHLAPATQTPATQAAIPQQQQQQQPTQNHIKTEPGSQPTPTPAPINTAIPSGMVGVQATGTPTQISQRHQTPQRTPNQPLSHAAAMNLAGQQRAGSIPATNIPAPVGTPTTAPGSAAGSTQGHPHAHPNAMPQTIQASKFPIAKTLPEKATQIPTPVAGPPGRPTLSGGTAGVGVMNQPVLQKTPAYQLEGEGERVLNKKKLDELVRQVCGGTAEGQDGNLLTPEVEEVRCLQSEQSFVFASSFCGSP